MRRPLHPVLVAALGLTLAATSVACSDDETSAVPADQAAEAVTAAYGLGPDEQACLEQGFEGDAAARNALEPGGAPGDEQFDGLADVILGCVGADRIGDAVAAAMATGLGTLDGDQQRCVATAVVDLPEEDLRVLVSGLASPAVVGAVNERSVRLGEVTNGLFAACSVGPSRDGEGSTGTTSVGDLGAVPEEDVDAG